MNGKLSVIIPVYNTGLYLKKALDSIVRQTYKNLEIIIIDDGSTDQSEKIYKLYAKNDNRILIHRMANSGVAAARNKGLSMADGNYITFFDSDDWIEEDAYRCMIALLESTGSDIVMCGYVNEFEDNRYEAPNYNISRTQIKTASEVLKDMLQNKNAGFSCNKIYRRKVIYGSGLQFDLRLAALEDFKFLVEICKSGPQFVCTEKAFYHYFRRSGSISRSGVNEKKFTMNQGSELILEDIKAAFPELTGQAAEFFYNTNIGLLDEVHRCVPVNQQYRAALKASIRRAGLLGRVNWKIRLKVILIMYFPGTFGFIKRLAD